MNNQATSRSEDRRMLTGMFRDKDSTEGAYRSLRDRGYTDDEINVMMSDETRDKYYSSGDTELEGNKALEGTGAGAAIGGTLGAIIGGIAAIGTNVLIPGSAWLCGDRSPQGLQAQAPGDSLVDWSVH